MGHSSPSAAVTDAPQLRIVAMHGWCGDAAGWEPWAAESSRRGWCWDSGERGYGGTPPHMPCWRDGSSGQRGRRTLVTHSLGWHLVPQTLLEACEQLVLLASFARFIPQGRGGRSLRQALAGMEASLREGNGESMLQRFLAEAAAPQDVALMPQGPATQPLTEVGRQRLLADLGLLSGCGSLPAVLIRGTRILVVEATEDRIVPAPSRRALLNDLHQAGHSPDHKLLKGVGHALLTPELLPTVLGWLDEGPASADGA